VDPTFFGVINLSQSNIIFAVLAGICQFFQSKMMAPKTSQGSGKKDQASQISQMMQKQMIYILPLFTVFILFRLPAAIGLYWIATSIFSIIQQYIIYSPKKKVQKI
ncbi:MAG: YidC/Oxa1 family membrane protein insertase, partial [Patescibacteria group bacterium]